MNKRFTAVLLCMTLLFVFLAGCRQEHIAANDDLQTPQIALQTPSASPDPVIRTIDAPRIDCNTAFEANDLPDIELTADSVAFLKRNEDGSRSVIIIRMSEIRENLPKRLPRTHYFEQFMDTAVTDDLLPLLDYALYRDCFSMCIPSARLSSSLVEESEQFLFSTYFDTYRFSARDVCKYVQPDGQTMLFLRIDFDNYNEIRDKYRRLDGMNSANAFVNNFPDGLNEWEKILRVYRWITETVRFYGSDGTSKDYYEKTSWSLLFDSMLKHTTVDAGYSETMTILCNLAGIECFSVKGVSHVWNIARVDGKYYRFDPTCDRGLTPADYRFFGVSDETFLKFHNAEESEPLPFYREYCPACDADLMPTRIDCRTNEHDPICKIVTYYEFLNDRNENPLLLLYCMDYTFEEIGREALKNGWIRTQVDMNVLMDRLHKVMTETHAVKFAEDYFAVSADAESKVSYHNPCESPQMIRLIGLKDNGNGIWAAQILRFRSPFDYDADEQTITMIRINDEWFVDDVRY